MSEKPKLHIDIISDIMCPWCFIGKRNLDAALEQTAELIDVSIKWRPYQLDPTIPKEGMDRQTYLNNKFGEERAKTFYAQIAEAGKAAGIDFKFEDIELSPNTIDTHRIIHWAGGQSEETQVKLVERLFQSYFMEGGNLTDSQTLCDTAKSAGMDPDIISDLLSGDSDVERVEKEIDYARELGVQGVPFFILDQKYAVTGAQPTEVWVQTLTKIANDNEQGD